MNDTGKKVAMRLIGKYVERGDTIEQLKKGQMGSTRDTWAASIGGYINGRRVSTDWIVVTKLNGREYTAKFKLKDVITSIKRGAKYEDES